MKSQPIHGTQPPFSPRQPTPIAALKPRQLRFAVLLGLGAALNCVLPDARAHTPPAGVVTNCADADLRAAMAGGGTITFACDGTIYLAGTISNLIDTMLDGTGHQVTISGSNMVRVFSVGSNVNFTIANLTIADGTSLGGSAILNLGGIVNLAGVSFRSNTATMAGGRDDLSPAASGGAIFNLGGTVNATNCSFKSNMAQTPQATDHSFAQVSGGAIRNDSGQVTLHSCAFLGNRASGGPSFSGYPGNGDPGLGGALFNGGTVTLNLCTFASNLAAGGAGASWSPISGILTGYAGSGGSGGAIFNGGTLTIDQSTFFGNTATGGKGGDGAPGTRGFGTHPDAYAGGNAGGANGGGICNSGSLWVTRSTLASNSVTGGSGGYGGTGGDFVDSGGMGAPAGNGGSGLGGALFNSGSAGLVNCTVAFNSGNGGAGGVGGAGGGSGLRWGGPGGPGGGGGSGFGGVDGTCNLTHCTVAWNVGIPGAGGAGGAGGSAQHPGAAGALGGSGNAWGGTVCSNLVNTLIASNTPAGNDSFPDAKLGPLANNGGPMLTMALLPGSPAIDAGDTSAAPATDQRGFPRPAGLGADIGAFEYASVLPVITVNQADATGISLFGSGNPGATCRLLTSSDLIHWIPIATNQIAGDGTILFTDNCTPGTACRFYRLVMP